MAEVWLSKKDWIPPEYTGAVLKVAVGVASVVVDTARAQDGEKGNTAVKGALSLGASYAGAEVGGGVGAAGGPVGAFAGALIGGAVGSGVVNAQPPNWSPQQQQLNYLLTQPAP